MAQLFGLYQFACLIKLYGFFKGLQRGLGGHNHSVELLELKIHSNTEIK
jgi:hypothetical protein